MASTLGKCTDWVRDRYCEAIKRGLSKTHAAQYAGISPNTVNSWLAKGQAEEPEEPYASFASAAIMAEAEGALARMSIIHEHAPNDWRAAAWLQEHCHPDHYGKRAIELTGAGGGPVQMAAQVVVVPQAAASADDWAAMVAAELGEHAKP